MLCEAIPENPPPEKLNEKTLGKPIFVTEDSTRMMMHCRLHLNAQRMLPQIHWYVLDTCRAEGPKKLTLKTHLHPPRRLQSKEENGQWRTARACPSPRHVVRFTPGRFSRSQSLSPRFQRQTDEGSERLSSSLHIQQGRWQVEAGFEFRLDSEVDVLLVI